MLLLHQVTLYASINNKIIKHSSKDQLDLHGVNSILISENVTYRVGYIIQCTWM